MTTARTNLAHIAAILAGALVGIAIAHGVAHASTGAADDAADLGWRAWHGGLLFVPVLLVVYLTGRAALDHRRYLAKRWPRAVGYLDAGKVWTGVAAAISMAATLLPLAITGDLTGQSVAIALSATVPLLTHSTRNHGEDTGSVPT